MLKKQMLIASGASLALLFSSLASAQEEQNSAKLPVEAFSVATAIQSVRVSEDGKNIGILRATSKRGDYILEVRPTDKLNAEPIRFGADKMEITSFNWLNNDKIVVNFRQNIQDGNRNYWVTKAAIVNADGTGSWRVPFPKENFANYSLLSNYREDPDHILLEYDINRDRKPDVIKYNINTGATKTVFRGNEKVNGGFVPDFDGEIRAGQGFDLATTSISQYARAVGETEWQLIFSNRPESREEFEFLYFSAENPNEVYVRANRGQNTAGIYTYNIETKEYSERLFGLESVDAGSVMLSSKKATQGKLTGFSYTGKHPTRYFTDEYEKSIYDAISAQFKGSVVSLSSRSEDDNVIVIYTSGQSDPGTYYLLKDKKDLSLIGDTAPLIEKDKLAKVKYVKYKARDGLVIPAYVTIPKGKAPFPTIVHPHGGPWARDVNVFDPWSQMMASNGYLVIQPQFRGSQGFGMELWKAGDKEWGLKMQDDLDDAAMYLVDKGLADKDRLAMFGWSYGGYASFVASMRENNIYKCSVAGAGVSDIDRIGASINASRFIRILQGPTVKGLNPLENVDKVNIPILVIHGDIDQRVPVEHSRDFVEKLKQLNKDHKYVELEGADHFSNTLYYEHKMEFYGELIDWFDNKCFPGPQVAAN